MIQFKLLIHRAIARSNVRFLISVSEITSPVAMCNLLMKLKIKLLSTFLLVTRRFFVYSTLDRKKLYESNFPLVKIAQEEQA